MVEIWQGIPEVNYVYEISNLGRIRHYRNKIPLKTRSHNGEITITIHGNASTLLEKDKCLAIARTVYKTFKDPNLSPKQYVGFRDGDCNNCSLDNLVATTDKTYCLAYKYAFISCSELQLKWGNIRECILYLYRKGIIDIPYDKACDKLRRCIKNGTPFYNYYFTNKEGE